MVFRDDILIYSPDLDTQLQHLTLVFEKLREHQLYMKASKFYFAQNKLDTWVTSFLMQGWPQTLPKLRPCSNVLSLLLSYN
jgi:hypothetical protein